MHFCYKKNVVSISSFAVIVGAGGAGHRAGRELTGDRDKAKKVTVSAQGLPEPRQDRVPSQGPPCRCGHPSQTWRKEHLERKLPSKPSCSRASPAPGSAPSRASGEETELQDHDDLPPTPLLNCRAGETPPFRAGWPSPRPRTPSGQQAPAGQLALVSRTLTWGHRGRQGETGV